ncbi:MAG: chromosomal replication initiator protein DnaA [Phototrophicales bacterium]
MNAKDAWDVAYAQLELQFDRSSFDTWLRNTTFLKEEGGTFTIGVQSAYARDMLQYRLYRDVHRVLCDVVGHEVDVQFEIHNPPRPNALDDEMPLFRLLAQQAPNYEPAPWHERIATPKRPDLPESELNPRFTFERFIVNGSNRITYEAARAVAENPGKSYNPFFIYGGVGLGKTHLLQAIAHVCQAKGLRTIYIPSEAFTNDLIASIRNKTTAMFRDKYRSADVLLVDDIQFIAGKDSTQEEFFHTFNALVTFNKQIVLASDRHPGELKTLEDRLRSRFEGGLVTDIQPLEFESRLALLEMWAAERDVQLPYAVLEKVANRAQSNVRELEGVFNQMVAKAQLGGLTEELADMTLEQFDRPRLHGRQPITIKQILEAAAAYFQVPQAELTGKSRTSRINTARQVTMYLVRQLTNTSFAQIGEIFGGRSHTTVLHGCSKIEEDMEKDAGLRHHIETLRAELRR